MQIRLSQIAQIPMLIQSTLEQVNSQFDIGQFHADGESAKIITVEIESSDQTGDTEQELSFNKPLTNDLLSTGTEELSELNTSCWETPNDSDADGYDDHENSLEYNCSSTENLVDETNKIETEQEEEKIISNEELLRTHKKQKIRDLEKSWPWADQEKIVNK